MKDEPMRLLYKVMDEMRPTSPAMISTQLPLCMAGPFAKILIEW